MPTTAQMRQFVYDAYPGVNWQRKVNKMTDSQIFVVYTRIIAKKERK